MNTLVSVRRFGSGLRAFVGGSLGLALLAGHAAMAQYTVTTNFAYTGSTQTWVVPTGVSSIQVSMIGGKGGNAMFVSCGSFGRVGGYGALVTSSLAVTPGSQLTIVVAGNGGNGCSGGPGAAGFGGGGAGGSGVTPEDGGGGGGASKISTGATTLVVAAGGGGCGGGAGQPGGAAGQPGYSGSGPFQYGVGGGAGTLVAGGVGGTGGITTGNVGDGIAGTLGQGGAGGYAQDYAGGGGGGGGLYGGGGGQGSNGGNAGGGGGGSSYSVDANAVISIDSTGVPLVSITYTVPIGSFNSLVVDTLLDENDSSSDPRLGTGTSLREAIAYANTLSSSPTITFAPALTTSGPATLTLTNAASVNNTFGPSELHVTNAIVLQGPTGANGVTIAGGVAGVRHVFVETSGFLTVSNLTFTGGTTADRGASILSRGKLALSGCTFTGNSSSFEGGAVHCLGNALSLSAINTTFAGNSAATHGGALVSGAITNTLTHCTIVDNTGAQAYWQVIHPATMINCIVARNFNGATPADVTAEASGSFSAQSVNNLVGTQVAGNLSNGVNGNRVGFAASKFLLGTLASNGGPTATVALLPGSPAINAGTAVADLTTDQRGLTRVVGSGPDVGAIEDSTGDGDPDGDVLNNVQELALGTNPLSVDTDNDGFNDATELLNSSDSLSGASVPGTTRIERVLGFGAARGLDLSGAFAYAFNVGPSGAAGQAGDADFTADNVTGVTVSSSGAIANWNNPAFGSTAGDDVLETVYQSIRWANHLAGDPEARKLKVDLAGLTAGRNYKLQLLFGEVGATGRRFDVFVDGTLVVNDFDPTTAQGGVPMSIAGSAVVHEFNASGSTLHIVLDGTDVASVSGLNRDPYLNGATLEILPTAPVAQADLLNRPDTTRVVKVLKSALLANDTDADLDTLTITAVNNALPAGATVALSGDFVLYTVPAANAGNGSFTYTVSDGVLAATASVTVTESSFDPGASAPNSASATTVGADMALKFLGVPGRTYRVQFTTDLTAPFTWQDFVPPADITAPASGVLSYTDVAPGGPSRFYRAVLR